MADIPTQQPATPDGDPANKPVGFAVPHENEDDPRTEGGQSPEVPEDRPMVGQVEPEDYPAEDRHDANVAGD